MSRLAVLKHLVDERLAAAVEGVAAHLRRCGFDVSASPRDADAVLVWSDAPLPDAELRGLLDRAAAGVPLLLAGPTLRACADVAAVTDAAGVVPGRATPVHPMRLRPGPDAGEVTARFDGDVELVDEWLLLDKVGDDVDVLLTAMTGLDTHAVMTWRPSAGVGVFSTGTRPETLAEPAYRRLVHRWLRRALGVADARPVRVGMLGYGAIGAEHAAAITAVDGLELAGVCDTNPQRVAAARSVVPEVRDYADADALVAADDVDLVVVSTPPNTHADWALRVIEAGKHVVVEKPFCITTAEADEMIAAAATSRRALAVYQNRRWDAD
ncbi:MAG: Gfo/Idh/MocA family oxidoreductase, partial [Frankiales bacterium]|nr:Gfo/Idh/MocA family oxidoreductase [Frankiales bacterium]